jgi:hypothetical protein
MSHRRDLELIIKGHSARSGADREAISNSSRCDLKDTGTRIDVM